MVQGRDSNRKIRSGAMTNSKTGPPLDRGSALLGGGGGVMSNTRRLTRLGPRYKPQGNSVKNHVLRRWLTANASGGEK